MKKIIEPGTTIYENELLDLFKRLIGGSTDGLIYTGNNYIIIEVVKE